MSISIKVLGLVTGMFISVTLLTLAVQQLVMKPAFDLLELRRAERDLARTVDSLQRDIDLLDNQVNDWAAWDESYQFVKDRNQVFIDENLVGESFANSHLNLICYVNSNGDIVWGEARESGTLEVFAMPGFFQRLTAGDPLVTHRNVDDNHKGLVLTERGPMIVVSRPVITTRREGPVRGSLLMGRLLTEEELNGIASRTRVQLDCWLLGRDSIPAEFVLARAAAPERADWLIPVDRDALHAYQVLPDLYGRPLLLFRVLVPREISRQGALAANVASWSSICGGLAIVLGLWILLKRQIVSPLLMLSKHAVRVGSQDDLRARLRLQRSDEIGTLAREFDGMVERLAESRERVADAAHLAGMARIATETLHNVGNALNSANCCLELVDERCRNSKLAGLDRAAGLLRENSDRLAEFFRDDARGPQLAKYIVSVNSQLQRDRESDAADLERLSESLHHIRDLVRAQQSSATAAGFLQQVDLATVCDGVLRLASHDLEAAGIRIARDFEDLPPARVDKNKLSQVLLNLVKNALQSLAATATGERTLTMRVRRCEDDGVRIEIEDTGIGFDQEVGQRLFQHGFTTRPGGHGFGLHFCANALTEMGGRIQANSPGAGQGATFSVLLPRVLVTDEVLQEA